MNEIIVISGKGGTGKTTLTASIIPYLQKCVIADCDVDAPDLDILFNRKILTEENFSGCVKAEIDTRKCVMCGKCIKNCKFDAIKDNFEVDMMKCEGCGVCEYVCPRGAVILSPADTGKIYLSDTIYGEIIHARLNPGEETSGKLVSEVRKRAKKIAVEKNIENIIVDGSPGIGCNVISSITGASKVIIVTEPTMSGLHDLIRVYELTQKFRLKVYAVINKYDLSLEKTEEIEKYCNENGIKLSLKIPFNEKIVEAVSKKEIPSIYLKEFYESIGFIDWISKELFTL